MSFYFCLLLFVFFRVNINDMRTLCFGQMSMRKLISSARSPWGCILNPTDVKHSELGSTGEFVLLLTSSPRNKLTCAQTDPGRLVMKMREKKKHQWHEEVFNKVVKLWLKCVIDFRQTIGHRDACENSQKRFLSLVKIPSIQWKHVVMPSLHTHYVHYSIHPKQVILHY